MKKVGRIFIEGQGLIIVFLFLVIPFASCVHKKAKSQLQPTTVKAIFKTELFTIRTDSLFPNGLMKNIEMYEETNRQLSHSFHFADSGKWGELKSDTIGGELMLFHGVMFQLDSFAQSYMNYEKAIYYIKKPLSITILRDNKIDATFIANGISKERDDLFLLEVFGANGPPGATPFKFHKYSMRMKIFGGDLK